MGRTISSAAFAAVLVSTITVTASRSFSQLAYAESAWTTTQFDGQPFKPDPTRFSLHANTISDEACFVAGKVEVAPAVLGLSVCKIGTDSQGIDGQILWTRTLSDPSWADAYSVSVTATPGGGTLVYLVGVVDSGSGKDILTAALDGFDGTVLWTQQWNNGAVNGDDVPVGIKVRTVFGYPYAYVGACSETSSPTGASLASDFLMIKYDGLTGQSAWLDTQNQPIAIRYDGPTGGNDQLVDFEIPPSLSGTPSSGTSEPDYIYATGTVQGATSGKDYAVIRINDATPLDPIDGVRDVVKTLPGTDVPCSISVAYSPPNSHGDPPAPLAVFVTGSTNSGTSGTYDFLTLSYSPDLSAERWLSAQGVGRYNGEGDKNDYARKVVSKHGFLYVVGDSYRAANQSYDIALIQYDESNGNMTWSPQFPGGAAFFPDIPTGSGEDTVSDMIVDKNGNVVLAGSTFVGSGKDILAVSFGADGQRRWIERVRDPQGNPVPTGRDFITYNGSAAGDDCGTALRLYSDDNFNHCAPVCILGVSLETLPGAQIAKRYVVQKISQCDVSGACGSCP